MNPTQFSVRIRKASPGAAVVDLHGALTGRDEAALTAAFDQAGSSPTRAVVLNLGGLQSVNSAGIGLLMALVVRARRQKKRLLACGLGGAIRPAFALTRLDEALAVYPGEPEALAAIA